MTALIPAPIPDRPFDYAPPRVPIETVFMDEHLLVINKPAGLLSVPGKADNHQDCLISRLQIDNPDALLIHRLDMATSGLMVFARNKAAQRHIGLQFEKRYIRKTYIADVAGYVESDSGTIDLPLICDWPNRPRQMVCHTHGKAAQTDWHVDRCSPERSRVILNPKTGRSHQLRVHMQTMGHPILGDRLYAPDAAFHCVDRLHLHASEISLRHPIGGDWMSFETPCPF